MSLPEKVKLEVSRGDLMEFANYLLNSHRPKETEEGEFISIKEVMKLSGKAQQTIYGRVSKGTIPYYKEENGGKLRFKKSEILEWMKSGKKMPKIDIQNEVDSYLNSNSTGRKIRGRKKLSA